MSELAAIALSWLSYVALHAAAPPRGPALPLAREPAWPIAMRVSSAALFVAAARAASPDAITGALIAGLAWMLAASVVPVAAVTAPRSRAVTSVVAAILALIALAWRAFDA